MTEQTADAEWCYCPTFVEAPADRQGRMPSGQRSHDLCRCEHGIRWHPEDGPCRFPGYHRTVV